MSIKLSKIFSRREEVHIYQLIKALCKKRGLTIRRLEIELGFANGSVCKWDVNIPSFDKVKKVADYLEVSLDELRKNGVTEEE